MHLARFVLALLVVAGAALAACSGNFGAGTSAPNGLLPSGPLSGIPPTPSPTPTSASNIVTVGDSTLFQPLASVAGYGGAIAFETPSPRPSGFQAVPVGATLSLALPTDAPDLNLATPGRKGKKRERPARALIYLTLLATRDITLQTFPRLAIDVPRDVVVTYRVEEINVALYNAGEKDKTFRLAAVEHDLGSPPPTASPGKTAPPPPTPIPLSAASGAAPAASGSPLPVPSGFPTGALPTPPAATGSGIPFAPSPGPSVSPTLPPQRILFASSAQTFKLTANKPVVFAIYALPIATPSPSPSAGGSAPSPGASGSGSPRAAAGSPAPLTSSSPGASVSPAAAGSPSASAAPSSSAAPGPSGT